MAAQRGSGGRSQGHRRQGARGAARLLAWGLMGGLAVALAGCVTPGGTLSPLPDPLPPLGSQTGRFTAAEPIGALAWSPDQTLLAGATPANTSLYLWDAQTGRTLWRADRAEASVFISSGLAFTADGLAVIAPFAGAAADRPDAVLTLLSVATGKVMRTVTAPLPAPAAAPEAASNHGGNLAVDGDMAAVVMASGRVGLFETRRWTLLRTLDPVVTPAAAAAAPLDRRGAMVALDRRRGVVALTGDAVSAEGVAVVSVADGALLAHFRPYDISGVQAMVYDTARGRLLTGGTALVRAGRSGETAQQDDARTLLRRWTPGGTWDAVYPLPGPAPERIAVSQDGQWVAAGSAANAGTPGYVLVWNAETGAVRGGLTHTQPTPSAVAVSPDNRVLAYSVGADVVTVALPPPDLP